MTLLNESGNQSTRGNIVFCLIHVLNLMVVLKGVEAAAGMVMAAGGGGFILVPGYLPTISSIWLVE